MTKRTLFALLFILNACGGSVEMPADHEPEHDDAALEAGATDHDAAPENDAAPDVAPARDAGVDADCWGDPTRSCKRDAAPDAPAAVCCQIGSTQTQIACAQDDAGAWSFECVYPNRISFTCLPSQCQLGAECTAGDGGVVVPCDQ